MRILHLSDLHLRPDWLDWVTEHGVRYDLVVLAGDLLDVFSPLSLKEQAEEVGRWLTSLPFPAVVCTGNHDCWPKFRMATVDTRADGRWLKLLRGKGSILGVDGDSFAFGGARIMVNGWRRTPPPHCCDILVTHAPPVGCGCACYGEGQDGGDLDLWDSLEDGPPRVVLCGHIHNPRRFACEWPLYDPQCTILVPGHTGDAPTPAHWILDLDRSMALHSSGVTHPLPRLAQQTKEDSKCL